MGSFFSQFCFLVACVRPTKSIHFFIYLPEAPEDKWGRDEEGLAQRLRVVVLHDVERRHASPHRWSVSESEPDVVHYYTQLAQPPRPLLDDRPRTLQLQDKKM